MYRILHAEHRKLYNERMSVVREEESIHFSLTGVDETFGLRGNQQQPVCDPLLPGVDVGGATLLRRIASGGMGVVFEAHHNSISTVAVKFLNGWRCFCSSSSCRRSRFACPSETFAYCRCLYSGARMRSAVIAISG